MMTEEKPRTTGHHVTLVREIRDPPNKGRPDIQFRGICSCGESSKALPNAGMVAGWEVAHREL